jgi:hypothetical protein
MGCLKGCVIFIIILTKELIDARKILKEAIPPRKDYAELLRSESGNRLGA